MNLLAMIKSKGYFILCVILATLLTASIVTSKVDRDDLKLANEKLLEHVQLNKKLSEQNLELAKEIRDKPVEYITITKEVERKVCDGKVKQELINSLPRKEVINEKQDVVDIDARLPDDLIKLLK